MRKMVAVLFILVCMAYITGCGGSSSSTANITVYDLPTLIAAKPTSPTALGGAIQGGVAPFFKNYSVSTFAGSSVGFNNISSTGSATFNHPIAVTTNGTNLYVADYANNAIRQINIVSKHVTTIAGITGLAGSIDTAAGTPSFNSPRDITTDGKSLYIADSGNYTIRKIDLSTMIVTTLAGAVGVAGSVDATIGTNARFNVLNGITTDGTSLYVTDSNNTIRRIVISSGAVTTLAGAPGTSGSADGIQAAARFNLPEHITTDGPNLYVTDFTNSTIRKIALATGAVTTIAGKVGPGGDAGFHADSTDGTGLTARFNQPNGITTDGTNLYVTDSYDNTVRQVVISSATPGSVYSGPVTTIAGAASGSAGGLTEGRGTVAKFNFPIGITTDGTSLFITDNQNNRIRKIQ